MHQHKTIKNLLFLLHTYTAHARYHYCRRAKLGVHNSSLPEDCLTTTRSRQPRYVAPVVAPQTPQEPPSPAASSAKNITQETPTTDYYCSGTAGTAACRQATCGHCTAMATNRTNRPCRGGGAAAGPRNSLGRRQTRRAAGCTRSSGTRAAGSSGTAPPCPPRPSAAAGTPPSARKAMPLLVFCCRLFFVSFGRRRASVRPPRADYSPQARPMQTTTQKGARTARRGHAGAWKERGGVGVRVVL